MRYTRDDQAEILDSINWESPIAQDILARAENGTITGDAAIAEYADLAATQSMLSAPPPRRASMSRTQPTEQLVDRWPIIQCVRAGIIRECDAGFHIDAEDYGTTPQRLLMKMAKVRDEDLYKRLLRQEVHAGQLMYEMCRDMKSGRRDITETNTNNQISSDFPAAIYAAFGRAVSNGYETVREPLADLLLRHCGRPVENFRDVQMFTHSEMPELLTVGENGAFLHADLAADSGRSGAVTTEGVLMDITRQALINQDFMQPLVTAEKAGKAAKMAISKAAVAVLADAGNALFTAPQGNLAAAPAAPGVDGWNTACQAMGGFTGGTGQALNIHPAVLLCGCTYESTSSTLRNAMTIPAPGPLLPDYQAGSFEVIADARIPDDSWYCLADPRQVRCLELLYLEGGAPVPKVDFLPGFKIDAVEARIRIDYGVAFSDWRGAYKFPATP